MKTKKLNTKKFDAALQALSDSIDDKPTVSRVDRMNAKTNILARRMIPGGTFNNLGGELRKCLPPQGTPISEQELCRRIAKVLRRWTKNVEEQGKKTGAVTDLELISVEYPLKRKVVK